MTQRTFVTHNGDTLVTDKPTVISFVEKCEEAGIKWRTYSGRGMYGAQTAGVTTGYDYDIDDLYDAGIRVGQLAKDNMGLGMIYYVV